MIRKRDLKKLNQMGTDACTLWGRSGGRGAAYVAGKSQLRAVRHVSTGGEPEIITEEHQWQYLGVVDWMGIPADGGDGGPGLVNLEYTHYDSATALGTSSSGRIPVP